MLLYFIIYASMKETVEARIAILLLYLSIAFYMLPFPILSKSLRRLVTLIGSESSPSIVEFVPEKTILVVDGTYRISRISPLIRNVSIVCVSLAAFFLIKTLISYCKFRKIVNNTTIHSSTMYIKKYLIKRKIEIRSFVEQRDTVPFSTGFFHPIIVLPSNLNHTDKHLVLLHEISHIQNYDFLVRTIVIFIRAVHWFNPLIYTLLWEIKKQQEFSADEWVMRQINDKEQLEYGELVVDSIFNRPQKNSHEDHDYISTFGFSSYKIDKERILRMKSSLKHKPHKNFSVVIAMVISICLNCLTIMAYTPPDFITGDISADGEYVAFVADGESFPDFSTYDYYFIAENGDSVGVDRDSMNKRRSCAHNWVNGVIQNHRKNADGSCDLESYRAKRCRACGNVVSTDELISTLHYVKCPH